MSMPRRPLQQVRSQAVWRTFLGPGAVEVAECLKLLGPCTAAEVMAVLHWTRAKVVKYLKPMINSGLVVEMAGCKASEHRFDLVAESIVPVFDVGKSDSERRRLASTMASLLRTTAKNVKATCDAGALELDSKLRNFSCFYELGYLTPEQFARVRSHIRQVTEIMAEGKKHRRGRLYAATMLAFPLVAKPAAPARAASRRRKA